MNRIQVITSGLQTTVQDLGRYGWAHHGVPASGAADPLSFRAANLLVGNAENAPALEMTLRGGAFAFESRAVVALTGSDFEANVPMWRAEEVEAGGVVRCGASRSGARCYLAVRGGLAVPKVMGSASVHVLTGVGGRPLRAGDVLPVGEAAIRRPRKAIPPPPRSAGPLRVTAGPQEELFAGELYRGEYVVLPESNRMGLRLRGPAIPSPPGGMLTEGVPLGAVQAPPDGQPIILFVEHQTTGGYPKPAVVISADFPRLGQLRPHDRVAFERVNLDRALGLLQEQERWLYALVGTAK
jgi:antagonist of KipI